MAIRYYKDLCRSYCMAARVTVSITADEAALIRAKMASVGVQIAELGEALEAHQKHVRVTLLNLVDAKKGGSG